MEDLMTINLNLTEEVKSLHQKVEVLGRKIEPEESFFHIVKVNSMAEFLQAEESLKVQENYKLKVTLLNVVISY